MVVDLDDVDIKKEQYGESIALIRGVLKGFIDRGFKIGGLQVKATSNILRGAGISSSAAFELLVCELLNYYYNDDKISRVEMAKIAQFAEMVYFGKPCGLLDQMGIALGGVNYIDFADVENPVIKTLTAKLEGYSIILVNTGGNHSDLTEHYAQIRTDMFEVAKLFNKEVLNEINPKYLIKNIPFVYRKLGGRHALRAMHFIDENKRVERGFEALQNGDTRLFLEMINRSGESSYKLLQNCYYAGDVSQGISLGTNLTKRFLKDAAVRVHGGGFAGTILAFVPNDQLRSYYDLMQAVYGEHAVMRVLLRNYGTTHVETL
jgi:galactokinase